MAFQMSLRHQINNNPIAFIYKRDKDDRKYAGMVKYKTRRVRKTKVQEVIMLVDEINHR